MRGWTRRRAGTILDDSMANISGETGAMPVDKDYAGDLEVSETWRILEEDRDSVLIDVRTEAEWTYVGLPDLEALAKPVVCVQWNVWPKMEVNADFVADVEAQGVTRGRPLLLICRSGVRSLSAAVALTAQGFGPCYNVAGGFEGDPDDARHRGARNGWKVAGLPWRQQ